MLAWRQHAWTRREGRTCSTVHSSFVMQGTSWTLGGAAQALSRGMAAAMPLSMRPSEADGLLDWEAAQAASLLGLDSDLRVGAPAAPLAWKCLEHHAVCAGCAEAPPKGEEGEYTLLQDQGAHSPPVPGGAAPRQRLRRPRRDTEPRCAPCTIAMPHCPVARRPVTPIRWGEAAEIAAHRVPGVGQRHDARCGSRRRHG